MLHLYGKMAYRIRKASFILASVFLKDLSPILFIIIDDLMKKILYFGDMKNQIIQGLTDGFMDGVMVQ